MGTNSPRGLALWMARATTSLPVPLSPKSMTGRWLAAALSISRRMPAISGDFPTRPCAHCSVVRGLILGCRINTYDEADGFLNRILADALGQAQCVRFRR